MTPVSPGRPPTHGDSVTPRCDGPPIVSGRDVPARHRGRPLVDGVAHQRGQRGHVLQQLGDVGWHRPRGDAEDAVSGRVQHPDPAVAAGDEQARGQALDDLRVQPLGGFGTGQVEVRSCAFSLVTASCSAADSNAVSTFDSRRCRPESRAAPIDPQQREAEHAGQEADDGR